MQCINDRVPNMGMRLSSLYLFLCPSSFSNGACLVYDITDEDSFQKVSAYVTLVPPRRSVPHSVVGPLPKDSRLLLPCLRTSLCHSLLQAGVPATGV